MNYVGDFAVGQEVYIWFNTFDSNDPSASVTMTTFVDTDVHIHKDDSLTQRNDAAGVAVDIDVDGIAGVHKITIQTADNTVTDFYEAGHDYAVRIEGVTVDAATLNPIVGTFSIANRRVAGEMCRSSIATLASQTSFTLTSGEASAQDDAYNFCTAIITDQTTRIQKALGFISDYAGSTRTVTLIAAPLATGFTMAVGDSVEILATAAFANMAAWNEIPLDTTNPLPNAASDAAGGLPISDAGGLDMDSKLANTNEVTTARMGALTDWINGGRLDLLLDAIPTTAMRGTDSAALASEVTAARMSELDDSAGKLVAVADLIQTAVDAIKLETDKLTLGDAGAGVAGSIIEEIENRPTTAMRGTDSAALASEVTAARMSELDDSAGKLVAVADLIQTAADAIKLETDKLTLGDAGAGVSGSIIEEVENRATPTQVNTEVDTAWTTQMADSVPADGTIPTREQMVYMVGQFLMEFAIASTTRTTKKVDGSTTLMTHTLDDDTTPTSLTRAT